MPKRTKGNYTSVKITGLFKSKKQGLYVGSIKPEREEDLANLKLKIKEAEKAGTGLVFFLWRNKYEDGPYFNLFVDVSQDQEEVPRRGRPGPPRRKIEEDDEEEVDLD